MKNVVLACSLLACGCAAEACPDPATGVPRFVACSAADCGSDLVTRFRLSVPYWSSRVMRAEPVLGLADPSGADPIFCLWRSATRITAVESPATGMRYAEGADFDLQGGCLRLHASGAIPLAPAAFPYTPDPSSPYLDISRTKAGTGLRIANDYGRWQVAVTYDANASPSIPPAVKPLPRYLEKLSVGDPVAITFYGDSITAGAGAATAGEGYAPLTAALLTTQHPGQISWRNASVAGWTSRCAAAHAAERLTGTAQDVVVVAFGMNDASDRRGPATKAAYKANILAVISRVRARAPTTEFLLVSSMRGNPEWAPMHPEAFDAYRDALREIEVEVAGVSVVDVTAAWDDLLARKTFYDMAANGANHPGDFGHVIYANLVSRALSE